MLERYEAMVNFPLFFASRLNVLMRE